MARRRILIEGRQQETPFTALEIFLALCLFNTWRVQHTF